MVPAMPMPADDGFVRQVSPSMAAVDEFLKGNKWGEKAIAAETGLALDGTTCYQSTCSPASDTASTEGDIVEDDLARILDIMWQMQKCKNDLNRQENVKEQPKPNN